MAARLWGEKLVGYYVNHAQVGMRYLRAGLTLVASMLGRASAGLFTLSQFLREQLLALPLQKSLQYDEDK